MGAETCECGRPNEVCRMDNSGTLGRSWLQYLMYTSV